MIKAFISGRKEAHDFKNGYAVNFLSISQKEKIVNWAHVFVLAVFILQSSFMGTFMPLNTASATVLPVDECSDFLGADYSTVAKWQWWYTGWQENLASQDADFTTTVTGNSVTANWTANPLIAKVLRKVGSVYTTFDGGSSGSVPKCSSLSHYCEEINQLIFCNGPICGNGEINGDEACDDGNADDNDGCSSQCQIETATLIVKKVVDLGTALPSEFTMQINGIDAFPGLEAGTATTVSPGVFQITEIGGPSDYTLVYSDACDETGSVTLVAGETKTCVLTNTYNPTPGTLLVRKWVVGGLATSSDWTMEIVGETSFAGSSTGEVVELLSGNMYQVIEHSGPTGYELSYEDDCGDTGLVSIYPEQRSICTLVNTHIPVCGDSLFEDWGANSEECDWGTAYKTTCDADYDDTCQYCTNACQLEEEQGPYCGDGVLQADHEQCDGIVGVDAFEKCNDQCQIEYISHCGDGQLNTGEECDDGLGNGTVCDPVYGGQCNWCSDVCEMEYEYGPVCGDGILNSNDGEECDDGGICSDNGEACTANDLSACGCTETAYCEPTAGDGCDEECQIEPGTLVVKKIVDNSRGGSLLSENFTMYIKDSLANLLYSFPGSSNGTATSVESGTYVVSENTAENYSLVYSDDCDVITGEVTLTPGESKTCTLTNTYTPPPIQTGELTVRKIVVGGLATSSDWTMNVGTGVHFPGAELGTTFSYNLGEYEVTESTSTEVDGAYSLTYGDDCDASGIVMVQAGQSKLCTLINTHVFECGDGLLEGNEECDDGNLTNNDGCNDECQQESQISGCKYNDENDNGVIDANEDKIGNWEIGLWRCPYSPLGDGVSSYLPFDRFVEIVSLGNVQISGNCVLQATTTTQSDGCFEFKGLMSGDYGVAETQSSAWTQTYPQNSLAYYFNLPSNSATSSIHFANNRNPYCGDGEVNQETEICDGSDGLISGYHCLSDCTLEKDTTENYCGDGVKNQSIEECDGSDGVPSGYTCRADCTLRRSSGGGGGTPPYYITVASESSTQPQPPVVKGEEGAPVLEVVKEIDRTQANPGDLNILYTIRVKNSGNLTAFNVSVEDILPMGLSFVDFEENTRNWSLEDIAAGEEKLILYGVDVLATTTIGNYVNIVNVSADNHNTIQTSASLEIVEIKVLAATGMNYVELSYLGLFAFLFVQGGRVMRKRFGR